MIGKRIAKIRKEKGLNQAQLAKQLNVSSSTIGMYEQERRLPDIFMVVQLSKVLEVSTDYLLLDNLTE